MKHQRRLISATSLVYGVAFVWAFAPVQAQDNAVAPSPTTNAPAAAIAVATPIPATETLTFVPPTASTSTDAAPAASPTPRDTSTAYKVAEFASGRGTFLYVAAGLGTPLFDNDDFHTLRFLRTTDALLTSAVITEGLKRVVREKRPDSGEPNSFPSGHATAAFAVATMASHYHSKQAPFWYAGAALISWSRVKKRRHYWHDVVAGAAVGYLTAKWELRQSRGLLLSPFINERESKDNDKMGFAFGKSF